ncbi:MAG: metalloregulator ArsR/SmtB family transcription factor [Rhodospirillaceae bacterium]
MNGDDEDLARLAKALGHPARVAILRHIIANDACFFGDLAEAVALAPSTISQHVSVLKGAGLLRDGGAQGRPAYCLNHDRLRRLMDLLGAIDATVPAHRRCCNP